MIKNLSIQSLLLILIIIITKNCFFFKFHLFFNKIIYRTIGSLDSYQNVFSKQ